MARQVGEISSAKRSALFGLYRICFDAGLLNDIPFGVGQRTNGTSVHAHRASNALLIRSHIN